MRAVENTWRKVPDGSSISACLKKVTSRVHTLFSLRHWLPSWWNPANEWVYV